MTWTVCVQCEKVVGQWEKGLQTGRSAMGSPPAPMNLCVSSLTEACLQATAIVHKEKLPIGSNPKSGAGVTQREWSFAVRQMQSKMAIGVARVRTFHTACLGIVLLINHSSIGRWHGSRDEVGMKRSTSTPPGESGFATITPEVLVYIFYFKARMRLIHAWHCCIAGIGAATA
eukprot:3934159-Rhodomonas_salina.1